jgi:sugar transferase (PEP-CTERM system associated)
MYQFGYWVKYLVIIFVIQLALYYHSLYEFKNGYTINQLIFKIFHALCISCIILSVLYFIFPQIQIATIDILFSIFIVSFFLFSWRLVYQSICKKGYFKEKIFLIGTGQLARSILEVINKNIDSGVSVEAIYHNPHCADLGKKYDIKEFNSYTGLYEQAVAQGVKTIVVALEERRGAYPLQQLLDCRLQGIKILDGIYFHEILTGKIVATQTPPSWLIFSEGFNRQLITMICKRGIDILSSLLAIIVFGPLMLIIALAIKINSPGKILFKQTRVGYLGQDFELLKFRSMVDKAEEETGAVWAQNDDHRITSVGKIIRKVRLDELPQFWNILKGEMSFIGPRPERPEFVDKLKERLPYYGERHSIKPGLTGWAQINYGYGASEEDALRKLEYDLFYIKHLSILFDLYIVFHTIKIVLCRKGR